MSVHSRIGLATAIALLLTTSAAWTARNLNPGVAPAHSKAHGKTYGDWGAEWWKWALSVPLDQSPANDPTGEFAGLGQAGPVWFLAGTFGGAAERTITIPPGKAIYFPLFNFINDYPCPDPDFKPAPGQTLEDFLTDGVTPYLDLVQSLSAEVDGVPISDLFNYRSVSELFDFTADASHMANDPCITGGPQQAVTGGYSVLLAPLRPGQHTIHFGSETLFGDFLFVVDVTYHITVAP
jgi:hypothetical protein